MQVAKLDMTNSSYQCPPGTRLRTDLLANYSKRLCGINLDGAGCSSTMFDVHGIKYMQVHFCCILYRITFGNDGHVKYT